MGDNGLEGSGSCSGPVQKQERGTGGRIWGQARLLSRESGEMVGRGDEREPERWKSDQSSGGRWRRD